MAETHVETSGRRRFTVGEKHRIVAEYSAADDSVGRGEVLRRWGTFQQNVSRWRRQIEAGTLGGGSKGLSGEERAKFRADLKRSNAAEAGFKTLKYRSDWPGHFADLDHATDHCRQFFGWYNHEHHHTSIGLVTPADRHSGNGAVINRQRQTVLDQAYKTHPERFPNGRPAPPKQPSTIWINPPERHSK